MPFPWKNFCPLDVIFTKPSPILPPNRQLRKPKCDNLLCFFKNEWNVKFKIFLWLGNFTLPIIEIRNWRLQKRKQKKKSIKKPTKKLKKFKVPHTRVKTNKKKICYCVCKYLSMLFLVISTKKNGFKKAIVKERTPSEYMALAVKKNRTDKKKSPVLYNKTQQKKHVIYSTRWTEKKRDFPYIFHSKICLFYATFCDHFLCLVKKKF